MVNLLATLAASEDSLSPSVLSFGTVINPETTWEDVTGDGNHDHRIEAARAGEQAMTIIEVTLRL